MSRAYNFSESGAGKYTVEVNNNFHYVDAENNVVSIHADAVAHSATLSGKLAAPRASVTKRATFTGKDSLSCNIIAFLTLS